MARPYLEVGGDDVLVGSVVAERYHVAGILGQGTTGTVFGVEHIHFGRRAAMKVLRPRSTQADVVHRVFNGDARAAWSVSHPCLPDVFDVGTLPDGAPFFVAEYLEGETLAKRMARDRISLAAAVDVMMQVLSAIAAVHERALLVRDLRPQNIFLAHRRGCRPLAKVLDLGLGRLTPLEAIAEQWDADAKSAAVTCPHPFYLSPERTRSEHGIDFASDLFVAGVVFYEMLTGARPFSASSYNGLLLQIAQANPTPVSELRDHSLPELDEYVERALSGNPRHRFSSAKEMQDELRRIFESNKRGASATTSTAIHTMHAGTPAAASASAGPPQSGSASTVSPGMPSLGPTGGLPSLPLPPAPRPPPQRTSQQRMPASSATVSSVGPIASELEPIDSPIDSPREQTLATEAPTATSTGRPVKLADDADLYGDETETDRKFFDLMGYRDPSSSSRFPPSSARAPASNPASTPSAQRFDSTAKSAPDKQEDDQLTQPPTVQAFKPMPAPTSMPIGSRMVSDDFEEPTESRNANHDPVLRGIRDANKTPPPPVPEEETQQLEMTPELRAKIEAQYAARPVPPAPAAPHRPPMQSEMDSIPPPTKRLDK
jgi:eukaryotic-like serine/threonine-protein kinase